MTRIEPDLRSKFENFSANERAKMATNGLNIAIADIDSPANLYHQLRDTSFEDIADIAEMLVKSYGVYLEFNRASTGNEKDWMYMIRVTIPGGGPITSRQWAILDDVAERYTASNTYTGRTAPSLRVTTRENIQLHWVKKADLVDAVREIAGSGFYTINGCGDNVRNVMGCPLSYYSKVFNSNLWAQRTGKYFRLPTAAYIEIFAIDPKFLRDDRRLEERFHYGKSLLNRKFKIAFSAVVRDERTGEYVPDDCVEMRTDDVGVAPILSERRVERFQIYIGGSQGEKTGYPTFSAMSRPLGVVSERDLLRALDAVVATHQEWGDRKNRNWARLKYVVYTMGIPWFRERVTERGVELEPPVEDLDYGARRTHHGWNSQERDGKFAYGIFLENGRIIDGGPNGDLRTMIRRATADHPDALLFLTPDQDVLFTGLDDREKHEFEAELRRYGWGRRNGAEYSTLRLLSGSCVGRDTCRLAYTESERFEPQLLDELEPRWGCMAESIGVTGCERQCFRPATKTIGWMGAGFNLYTLKVGGTEDGRNQGGPLIDPKTQEVYLRLVPRVSVARVTNALFEFYTREANPEELKPGGMGYFFKRVGARALIEYLQGNSDTSDLMKKTDKNPLAFDPSLANPSLQGRVVGVESQTPT